MSDAAVFDTLARALRELHRTLMERAKREFERVTLTTLSPGELLELLTTSQEFAWLRELSELMADIDVVRDSTSDAAAAMEAIWPAVEHLLATPDADTPFAKRYWAYVHDEPDVAIAHASVRKALGAFPPHGGAGTPADRRRDLAARALELGRRKPRA